ncbi:hypothetical protein MJO28_013592 [Puccinia striiformis f. sp. tritici]|uniref:Uncharacterized protein n=1 Tax=Puccinia striiformis f. sp. tritici TaxID=168172 RepID=A0ACC0DW28_9BASI|nr:hypothetical protein MJO28_013592 [Puccinia striiformis f. sp. tritici]KAI7941347.1 hypothetical protein MJO29_013421 [Puccinia striiformis f. sp. tritici]
MAAPPVPKDTGCCSQGHPATTPPPHGAALLLYFNALTAENHRLQADIISVQDFISDWFRSFARSPTSILQKV